MFAAKLEGRDPATEKREGRQRLAVDRVEQVVEIFDQLRLAQNRSRKEVKQLLDRVVVSAWRGRSIHEVTKRDVLSLIGELERRGTPYAANKLTKVLRSLFGWCVGRGILERSPMEGVSLPFREIARDRTLDDEELAAVLKAARAMEGPYGGIVELLALTGQRREEVARMTWDEIDLNEKIWSLPGNRTKNGKAHTVHLSAPAVTLLGSMPHMGEFVFTLSGRTPFANFTYCKRQLDSLSEVSNWRLHDLRRTVVSGMARLGAAPHIADRILNHVGGTIQGVAAVYQRHEFLTERKEALGRTRASASEPNVRCKMAGITPDGYLTVHAAIHELARALYTGRDVAPAVTKARAFGICAHYSREELDHAAAILWSMVESGRVTLRAEQPKTCMSPLRIDPSLLASIPFLKNFRVAGLSYLRPSHPQFEEFSKRFEFPVSGTPLLVKHSDFSRTLRQLLQTLAEEAKNATPRASRGRGRPSKCGSIMPAIVQVVNEGLWKKHEPLQKLRTILQELLVGFDVGESTIRRGLDKLAETDPRFLRKKRRSPCRRIPACGF